MLLLPRAVRILLAREPVDMRNSIDGLAALVRTEWKENLYAGHLFVFVSRRGDRIKILSWDAGGFVLTYKRLEQGRFRLPTFREDALGVQLDATQLAMLLDGIDVTHVRRPGKWAPPQEAEAMPASGGLVFPDRWQSSRRRTSASGGSEPRGLSGKTSLSKSASALSSRSSPFFSGPSSERRVRSCRASKTNCGTPRAPRRARTKRR
jgi:transposase